MRELLGAHESIAEDLLRRINDLADGIYNGPNVVVIRGASGVGKTAIVQRLYELLRTNADAHGSAQYGEYWPPLNSEEDAKDPLRGRARLSPDLENFVWKEDTLPTFGWWSFNCEELRNNQKIDVVAAGRQQMAAHVAPLSLAWWNASGASARAGRVWSDVAPRIRKDLQADAADTALEVALDALSVSVPLPATLTNWARDVAGWVGNRHRNSRNLHRDVHLGDEHLRSKSDAGAELAEAILSLTTPGLPAVVAIEDMHLMGTELESMLEALAAADTDQPVLIVGTAWPEGMVGTEFERWYSGIHNAGVGAARVLDVEVPPLPEESLVELLLQHAPNTSQSVAQQVVAKLNTPLFLLLWLTDPNVALEIRLSGDRVILSDQFALPDNVEQVIENRWKALPADVQHALTAAVIGNPSDPSVDSLNRFVPGVVAHVVEEMYQAPAQTAYESIHKAHNPIGWCQGSAEVLNFADPLLVRHVRKSLGNLAALKQHAQGFAQQACARWLDEQRDELELPRTAQVDAVVDWFLQFPTPGQPEVVAAAHIHAAQKLADVRDYAAAIDHFNQALNALGADAMEEERVFILRQVAECHYALSEFRDAEAIAIKILPLQRYLDGLRHPETMACLVLQARILMRSGDPTSALPPLDEVEELLKAAYGDNPIPADVTKSVCIPAFTLRGDVAFENHEFLAAAVYYDHAISATAELYGNDSHHTLALQLRRLRAFHAQDPTNNAAFVEGTDILRKLRDISGPDSPAAFEAEIDVLFWGYKSNHIADIEAAFRDLDHRIPQTRVHATSRALLYLHAGTIAGEEQRYEDSENWLTACLRITEEYHGSLDPLSLRAAHELGVALSSLGRFDAARTTVETLIENCRIAVGSTGVATVRAEILRAIILNNQGRAPEAYVRLKRVYCEVAGSRDASELAQNKLEEMLNNYLMSSPELSFRPLVQAKSGRFDRLQGCGSEEDPLLLAEAARPFPTIANQKIVIEHAERSLEHSPEHWATHLKTIARANLNLGACYWRMGDVDSARTAFKKADDASMKYFLAAHEGGNHLTEFAMAQVAALRVAVNINSLVLILSSANPMEHEQEFENRSAQAKGLLGLLRNEEPETLGNVDVAYLESALAELIG